MTDGGSFWIGFVTGVVVGCFTMGMILSTAGNRGSYCKSEVCEARSGRYLDGRCYEADGLREVKR
jgi:hypothetical protein